MISGNIFVNRLVKLWNSLPDDVVSACSGMGRPRHIFRRGAWSIKKRMQNTVRTTNDQEHQRYLQNDLHRTESAGHLRVSL